MAVIAGTATAFARCGANVAQVTRRCGVEVGVLEHDRRRLAAELEGSAASDRWAQTWSTAVRQEVQAQVERGT